MNRDSGVTLLPEALDTPLRETAEALGLPVEAYYLALLSVAASLIPSQTRLVVDPSTGFEVPPALWSGLVGETGSGVSHILNTVTQPLKDLQEEYHQRYQHQLKEYKASRRKRKRKRGKDAGELPKKPKPVSLYTLEHTPETVTRILDQQPDQGLLILLEELAVFLRDGFPIDCR
jgi:CRP-like cAMP-binding protein